MYISYFNTLAQPTLRLPCLSLWAPKQATTVGLLWVFSLAKMKMQLVQRFTRLMEKIMWWSNVSLLVCEVSCFYKGDCVIRKGHKLTYALFAYFSIFKMRKLISMVTVMAKQTSPCRKLSVFIDGIIHITVGWIYVNILLTMLFQEDRYLKYTAITLSLSVLLMQVSFLNFCLRWCGEPISESYYFPF